MSSSNGPREHDDPMDDDPELLNSDEVAEEVIDDGDVMMDSDDENEEVELRNDSIAYMDTHKDSVFCIAAHPTRPNVIATGGSEGDEDDAPGKGYITDMASVPERPVLPASYSADPAATHPGEGTRVEPVFAIDGHADSINCVTFTLPVGDAVVTGGLDGKLMSYAVGFHPSTGQPKFKFLDEAQEVPEINFLLPCPNKDFPNTVALGASDGSVWVYKVGKSLEIVQSYFVHAAPVTAGAWTPDGNLLATVDEEGCLYVFDVYGVAAGKEVPLLNGGATVVSLTAADSRFAVEGGLYSVAVEPKGSFLAVGGAGGAVKIISLPKLGAEKGSEGQAGQILASLQVQSDGVEALAFAPEPLTLLAAGSVDGSIAVFDTTRRFAVRRHIVGAHEEFSVVKVEWVKRPQGGEWALTSCGMDGVVRRWDLRATGSTAGTGNATVGEGGLIKEWKGHRGDGEKGGVLGFVQNEDGSRVITAGDDGIVLVFEG